MLPACVTRVVVEAPVATVSAEILQARYSLETRTEFLKLRDKVMPPEVAAAKKSGIGQDLNDQSLGQLACAEFDKGVTRKEFFETRGIPQMGADGEEEYDFYIVYYAILTMCPEHTLVWKFEP